MKLPIFLTVAYFYAHLINEAPRPQGGASRKRNVVHIVPLDPAYPGLGGACGALAGQTGSHASLHISHNTHPLTPHCLGYPHQDQIMN